MFRLQLVNVLPIKRSAKTDRALIIITENVVRIKLFGAVLFCAHL